jgi:hypothetical protein
MSPSSVSIVDPDEMVEVGRTTTGPMPHGSRLSPDGLRHYSCSMMSGELFELDAVGFEVLRVLALSEKGSHGPEGSGSHGEMMQDPSKPTWVQPHPTLPLAYVCLNGADQIAEVDLERWEVSRRFSTGAGPYNLAITPDGHGLVATYKTEGTVGFWNLKTGEEFARIPSSRAVTHGVVLSANGRHAFVSSEGIGAESGALDVFDMNSAALIDTVELGLQAGGICFWKSEAR